ncbi:hypothetical protein [Bailinhaonella thermotolerans]|uniref:hypothetical protein n=1 Tax=Bailinhaonella thermotolerans TaxID=1070861 RepID=UPI00192A38CB|nr:hypothetical protein [Bailinhaonella thermotolerans]
MAAAGPYELPVAAAMAVVTVTSALVTFLSVMAAAEAVETDRLAVVQTVQVEAERTKTDAQVRGEGRRLGRYRSLAAEADAEAAEDPGRAAGLRRLALEYAAESRVGYLGPYVAWDGAESRLRYGELAEALRQSADAYSPAADQPARTAARADAEHARSTRLAMAAVALLVVLVVLTVTRMAHVRLRGPLLVVAAASYALIAATVVWQAFLWQGA